MAIIKPDTGFRCECGKWHEYPMYVRAHSLDVIEHTCPDCGAIHSIIECTASLEKSGKAKKTTGMKQEK